MDSTVLLLQKLNEYCDKLIGETTESKSAKKAKERSKKNEINEVSKYFDNTVTSLQSCKKKKKLTVNENTKTTKGSQHTEETVGNDKELKSDDAGIVENSTVSLNHVYDNIEGLGVFKKGSVVQPCNGSLVTNDGFKIVSSIPEDDSDISDAFESDVEEEDLSPQTKHPIKPSRKVKTTEDGFKVMSEIPPDDSDVSDAFTDEEECDGTGEELVTPTPRKQIISANSFSKPILQMIDDFGLGENILKRKQPEVIDGKVSKDKLPEIVSAVKKSKKKKKLKENSNTTTLAAKGKPQVDVTVYDYTKKRGTKKVSSQESVVDYTDKSNTREKLEKDLKRIRFEVFKLGMTGFEKQKRKETRVALAVKLGAKPSKKEYVSYKDLLVTKAQEKVKEKEKHEKNKEMGIKEKKKFKKPKDKKKPRAFTAQIGRFKEGVQYLSKKDLHKIKRS